MDFPDSSLEVKEEEGEDYELPEGNLSRGIDNKTVRRYVGNLNFFSHVLFSVTQLITTKWFKIAVYTVFQRIVSAAYGMETIHSKHCL